VKKKKRQKKPVIVEEEIGGSESGEKDEIEKETPFSSKEPVLRARGGGDRRGSGKRKGSVETLVSIGVRLRRGGMPPRKEGSRSQKTSLIGDGLEEALLGGERGLFFSRESRKKAIRVDALTGKREKQTSAKEGGRRGEWNNAEFNDLSCQNVKRYLGGHSVREKVKNRRG